MSPLSSRIARASAVLLLTLLAYLPVLGRDAGFLWDDDALLWNSPVVVQTDGLARAWLPVVRPEAGAWRVWEWRPDPDVEDFWPLTHTVLWLEWRLFDGARNEALGEAALARTSRFYRAVNVALHVASALLFWLVLARLGVRLAWLGGVLFALHPVAATSVAWVAELKNTLSLPLGLAALACYLRFDASRRAWPYLCAFTLFVLCLLAKTSLVALPFVMLGCVWWRRGALGWRDIAWCAPLLAASLLMGLTTILFQHAGEIVADPAVPPGGLLARLALAGSALWFYLGKALLPIDLMMFYPRWQIGAGHFLAAGGLGAVALGLVVASWRARDRGWAAAACLALGSFVALLLPVLGLFEMRFHLYSFVSDHFAYAALLPPIALVVAAAGALGSTRQRRGSVAAAAAVVAIALGIGTHQRAQAFRTPTDLYEDAIAKNPEAFGAYQKLAAALARRGQYQGALGLLDQALAIKPDYVAARSLRAQIWRTQGRADDALADFRRIARENPRFHPAHFAIGQLLEMRGDAVAAIAAYRRALEISEAFDGAEMAHNNLGNLLRARGDAAGAERAYLRALDLEPDYALAYFNLGELLALQGRAAQAEAELRRALQAARASEMQLGALPEPMQRADVSAQPLSAVIGRAHARLGEFAIGRGDYDVAVNEFRAALGAAADEPAALNGLAWVLASHPDGEQRRPLQAVALAERLIEAVGTEHAGALETLEVAYTSAGRSEDAREARRRRLALDSGTP